MSSALQIERRERPRAISAQMRAAISGVYVDGLPAGMAREYDGGRRDAIGEKVPKSALRSESPSSP